MYYCIVAVIQQQHAADKEMPTFQLTQHTKLIIPTYVLKQGSPDMSCVLMITYREKDCHY